MATTSPSLGPTEPSPVVLAYVDRLVLIGPVPGCPAVLICRGYDLCAIRRPSDPVRRTRDVRGRFDMSNDAANGCRIVVLCSPKGGTGKSSLARHLLVSAAQDGVRSIGVDFDKQGTLTKWQTRREKTRITYPNFVETSVVAADLNDWRAVLARVKDYAIVIIDTPPSGEGHIYSLYGL